MCYAVLCLASSSLTGKSSHMCKSLFLAVSCRGGSRLAQISALVLAVLFLEEVIRHSSGTTSVSGCSDDPTSISWNSSFESPSSRSEETQGHKKHSS